jgi:heme-degrading monooxygenase HmoA
MGCIWRLVPSTVAVRERSEGPMHVRLTRIQADAERLDDMARMFKQETLPQIEGLEGFKGYQLLGDRSAGTAIAVVSWESAEAMEASEDAVKAVRQQAADAAARRFARRNAGPWPSRSLGDLLRVLARVAATVR